jgi:predicted cation transporter
MSDKELLKESMIQSWLGIGVLGLFFIAINLNLSDIIIGALAVFMAVLFMNGLGKTEIIFATKTPAWWKEHKSLHIFHHLTNEGELAGILVGVILFLYLLLSSQSSHVHLPIAAALALGGIMAGANMATNDIVPLLNRLERYIGVWGAVWVGSLLSSLTGAASSVFLSNYLLKRVQAKNKDEVAIRLSAGIGMGNGLLPFVAPPILIVWALLQDKLGWTLIDLLLYVGIIAIIYSGYITYKIKNLVLKAKKSENSVKFFTPWLGLLLMVLIANVLAYENLIVMIFNLCILMLGIFRGVDFNDKWQPMILGLLLIALEIIGHVADPFISWLAKAILPENMPILLLGVVLFAATAWISHVADNALASRIFVAVILAMPQAVNNGDFLIASVLIGALFGGFLLIPGNIPNFPIARIFAISSGAWLKAGLKIYYTAFIPIIWIVFLYFVA